MKTNLLTADQLNEIQDAWMALDCSAPEIEKNRVFGLMNSLPKSFVSATSDLKTGVPMFEGSPAWVSPRPIVEAVKSVAAYANKWNNTRSDVVWVGATGKWVSIAA